MSEHSAQDCADIAEVLAWADELADAHNGEAAADALRRIVAVARVVRDIHARRLMIDVYGSGSPYCNECRQTWPCATEQAVTRIVGERPLPPGEQF